MLLLRLENQSFLSIPRVMIFCLSGTLAPKAIFLGVFFATDNLNIPNIPYEINIPLRKRSEVWRWNRRGSRAP